MPHLQLERGLHGKKGITSEKGKSSVSIGMNKNEGFSPSSPEEKAGKNLPGEIKMSALL